MPSIRPSVRTFLLSTALVLLCATGASAAGLGVGTVNADGLRLRAEASTDASILATANSGTHTVVLEDTGDGWYKVSLNGIEGYMSGEYLDVADQGDADLGQGKVESGGSTLNVRSGPGTSYDRLGSLNDGAVVDITGVDSGWYKISFNGSTGYVSGDYLAPCTDSGSTSASSALGQQIVDYAMQYLGTPYVWGGNGPNSFDCSGFTKYVYNHFGYNINRRASHQLQNGVAVDRSELQAGDLVFFYNGKDSTPVSHVGIYIGDGDFIHASSNSYTVEISSLYAPNYDQKYVYARRII